jgi:hypothetical protein
VPESVNPQPTPENQPLPKELITTREDVIWWANDRRIDARRIENRTLGVAKEHYIVGDNLDVPYFSERIRITPIREASQGFRDLFLYFPYGLQKENENVTPPLIFVRVVTPEDVTMRYVISKHKTSAFLSKDTMHVAMEHFETKLTEVGFEAAFPQSEVPTGARNELDMLKDLLTYLKDKSAYRITSQPQEEAA